MTDVPPTQGISDGVRTTCPYCGVGCGVIAKPKQDGGVTISGDPDHPANFGRLCSKGSALAETIGLEERLLHPEIGGRRAGWDEALDLVAEKFSRAVAAHGPDSVAFYLSGQLLTEDYYVANKLMKGFIGSANIDTNSRLCMASSVAGHRRAFGSDTVPGTYEDLELADLVVLVGSNLAWCHPVLYQRLAAAKEKRPQMKIVLIDPRRTMTGDIADLHLAIAPDGDSALFAGLLRHLEENGVIARDYVEEHTIGFNEALAAARRFDVAQAAMETGLAAEDVETFYRLFAAHERTVTVYSQGVNQSASGTDKVSAIINCHLATGRIGRPGMGPFSVTGQPNAMGGREVGGLANMLAAHMDIENGFHRALVQDFWRAPRIAERPGLKAVDLFRAVGEGRIKALWIMATNPADSMPEADAVVEALKACPFVVVSDIAASTDTLRHAHVKLPSAGWGEKAGTVTNSERRISRQRAFLAVAGEARPDWWQLKEVARRMGFSGFDYEASIDIFREHASLSAHENLGSRDFDIGAYADIDADGYEALQPFQWPAPSWPPDGVANNASGAKRGRGTAVLGPGTHSSPPLTGEEVDRPKAETVRGASSADARLFANGKFFTPDRRARFVAVTPQGRKVTDLEYPIVLNTGRIRDQWHTMTRTGKSARLSSHMAEPFAEIHPEDAERLGLTEAGLVRVESPHGSVVVRALLSRRQRIGSIFVPMHWTDQFTGRGRVDALVAGLTDPVSGQPALKNVAVRVKPFAASAYGFVVSHSRPATEGLDYWALARSDGGWRMELALADATGSPEQVLRKMLSLPPEADIIAYRDQHRRDHRLAAFMGETLLGALYLSPDPVGVARSFAVEQLRQPYPDPRSRYFVVAGRAGADRPDAGAIVCSCFGVGANQIASAARAGCASVEAIGRALYAGTNCGSCRAEIRGIVEANAVLAAE